MRWPAWLTGVSLAVVLVAVFAVFVAPVFAMEVPRPLSFVYQMDRGASNASWLAELDGGVLAPRLESVAAWRKSTIPSLAIGRKDATFLPTIADAPPEALSFPEARIVSIEPHGERSRLRIELQSPRGAAVMRLRFGIKFDPRLVSIGELQLDGESRTTGVVIVHTVPHEGIVVGVEIDSAAAGSEFVIDDETPGLPPAGAPLLNARGADSVPIHGGDRTLLSTVGQVPVLR
jgi:hypothetical protein